MTNIDELVTMVKRAEAKVKEEKCNKVIKTVLAIIGVVVVVALIAFTVYKFITRCKKEECECEDTFEDEESCIELEFVYPSDEEAVPAEAEEVREEDEE